MTIRSFLTTRIRWLLLLMVGSWLFAVLAGIAAAGGFVPTGLIVIPFLGFGAAVLVLHRIRCPRCEGPLGHFGTRFFFRPLPGMRAVNFCPYCGVNFDEHVEERPPAKQ